MRVVIAEDAVLLRAGLERLLEEAGHEVVGSAGEPLAFMAAVERQRPDLVLVDVRMPPTHTDEGVRAAIEVRDKYPETGVLVLSQYVEQQYASELLAGGAEGVGYLLKDRVADVAEFTDAVERVGNGGVAMDPEAVGQLLGRQRREGPLDRLTVREREVLAAMAEGHNNVAIARQLFITEGAVEKHISSIFSKLGIGADDAHHRRVVAVLRFLQA